MNKSKAIYNLIIFYIILIIEYCFSYIIYPFKTRITQIENTKNNITLLFRSLLDNNIYINIEIGKPKQIIDAFLRLDSEIIYCSENNKSDLNPNYNNPQIYDVNSSIENFFNKNISSTFEMTSKSASVFNDKGKYANDLIYFKTNKENNELRTSFALLEHTRANFPCVIGFKLPKYHDYLPYNIIDQLKSNDIVNSYVWMINYTSDYEGNLIIGEPPHEFDPEHYKEEDLLNAYTFAFTTITEFGLRFDEITFNGRNFRPYHECIFKYEINYIFGIDVFEKEMDKYFNESIINGTCFKEYVKYPYSPHTFFYCNKEKYKDNFKYFPPLSFQHNNLNYTFELNYKDLFIEKDDKIIFMVFFGGGIDWYLGKPFLRKYPFLMNQDPKEVKFYTKTYFETNENDKNKNKKSRTNIFKSNILEGFIISVLFIILLVLGIILGKYYFQSKMKPMNVIDDEYEYKAADNEDLINNGGENKIN